MKLRFLKKFFFSGIVFTFFGPLMSTAAASDIWQLVDRHEFGFLQTLERIQGLTTDSKGTFWFSSNYGMIRTTGPLGSSDISNSSAIPIELKRIGANHIGDIDFGLDRIYAPIEDGSDYKHPHIGIYDPQSLQLIEFFPLVVEDQPDGVPWIAVDSQRQRAYSSTYANASALIVYDLENFKKIGSISLSETLHGVQGAKVDRNQMYLTTNSDKSVYQVDLETGRVKKCFRLPENIYEIEGLAIYRKNEVLQMAVLAIVKPGGSLSRRSQLLTYVLKGTIN